MQYDDYSIKTSKQDWSDILQLLDTENIFFFIIVTYLILINIIAIIVTIADKVKAQLHKWRISEATLFVLAALGGSVGMYITMNIIRHKTQKPQFMLGIPAIFMVEALLTAFIIFIAN